MSASPTHSDADFSDAMDGTEGSGEARQSVVPPGDATTADAASVPLPVSRPDSQHTQETVSRGDATPIGTSPSVSADSPARKGPAVAALMARFQKGASTSSAASSASASSSRPAAPSDQDKNASKDAPQENHADGDSSTLDDFVTTEAASSGQLTLDEAKIPPSEGAVSLIDPETTIENPFRSSDGEPSSSSSADRQSPPTTPTMRSSSAVRLDPHHSTSSVRDSAINSANTMSPRSTARFSEISLSSSAPRPSYADSSGSGSRRSSKRATMTAFNEKDTLASQLQDAANNPAPSSEGMEKLRENFEKLHQQQQQKRNSHARQHSHATDVSANGVSVPSTLGEESHEDGNDDPDDSGDTMLTTIEDVDWDFWGRVMSNYHEVAQEDPRGLSRAIQAGIPAQLRGLCWQLLSASKDEEMEIIYAYYIRQTSTHEKQIRKDLSRTFPEQDYFKDGKGVGQENLYNVVKAYSLYDEECGYCQGMQFIVGPLLMHMPDEEAFSTLVRLMKSYGLRGHFVPNMPGLQLRLFQFDRLLEDILPLLHRHLTRQGIKASMYASQWFMTLFSYRFPLDFVYRILDSVFAEGLEAVFRFAVSLMKRSEDALIELPFEQALAYLKGSDIVDVYKVSSASESTYDVDAFARDAFAVQVTPYMLDGYATEFEDSVRAANAHRREVEALRLVNRNLAARVASLEEQLQQISAEHVDLVKQAVMSKVAKEEMEEDLIRYKMLFAEASLRADQAGERTSSRIMSSSNSNSTLDTSSASG